MPERAERKHSDTAASSGTAIQLEKKISVELSGSPFEAGTPIMMGTWPVS
jgi:hypothetical protein